LINISFPDLTDARLARQCVDRCNVFEDRWKSSHTVTVDPSDRTGMDMTDQQWTIIEPLFEEKRRPDGRGRPWRDARVVLTSSLDRIEHGASQILRAIEARG
jgi:hypothetical protein